MEPLVFPVIDANGVCRTLPDPEVSAIGAA
jgi:hypothetical protein